MMQLWADESVDRQIVEELRRNGHSVHYVAEMDPGLSDDEVLEQARTAHALLITADKDFGELVFRLRRISEGVLFLRLAGLPPERKARITSHVLALHAHELKGAFTVLTAGGLRIRRDR